MGIRMVIELSDPGSVQTVVQALEAYNVPLRVSYHVFCVCSAYHRSAQPRGCHR